MVEIYIKACYNYTMVFCTNKYGEKSEKMTEQEKRKHRVCFTGHRPEKLDMSERKVKSAYHRYSVTMHKDVNTRR